MAETQVAIGYGHVLEIALASAPSSFTYIREVFSATPPNETDDNVEATHMQSPGRRREYVAGLSDGGETSYEMNFVAGSATDAFIRSIRNKKIIARDTFANGVQISYPALRQSYEISVPNDDKQTATLGLKVSGDPYVSAVAAPRNLVAPTISGTAQVGVVLTLVPGDWAGATGLTYQWQADTGGNGTFANVSGATSNTFVPTADQQGDDIRCVVTGANGTYSLAVNTAETAATLAAA